MRVLVSVLIITCLLGMSSSSVCLAEEPAALEPIPSGYDSPQAAYEAYAAAGEARDWKTQYDAMTPATREMQWWGLNEFAFVFRKNDEAVIAALEQFGITDKSLDAVYYRKYQEKHGIDLENLRAEHEKNKEKVCAQYRKDHPEILEEWKKNGGAESYPGEIFQNIKPEVPGLDRPLFHQSVLSMVPDQREFFAALTEATTPTEPGRLAPRIGKLQRVTISGERATGYVMVTTFHLETAEGRRNSPVTKPTDKVVADQPFAEPITFRRIDGRWYVGD